MKYYTQLTQDQRYQIYAMNKVGMTQKETAVEVGVHRSTISRELRRNTGLRGYRPQQAHIRALSRRDKAVPRIVSSHWQEIERLLRDYWSPEQIAWRLYEIETNDKAETYIVTCVVKSSVRNAMGVTSAEGRYRIRS